MGLVIILQSVVIVVLLIQRNTKTRMKRFLQRLNWTSMYTNHVYSTVLICQLTMSMVVCPLHITMIKW